MSTPSAVPQLVLNLEAYLRSELGNISGLSLRVNLIDSPEKSIAFARTWLSSLEAQLLGPSSESPASPPSEGRSPGVTSPSDTPKKNGAELGTAVNPFKLKEMDFIETPSGEVWKINERGNMIPVMEAPRFVG